MSSRLIIAATDISSSPVLARRFRGKTAKEIYRCGKGILVTGSVAKPIAYAVATIPAEMTKGVVFICEPLSKIFRLNFLRYSVTLKLLKCHCLFLIVHKPLRLKGIIPEKS